jgi:hypothetical protein
MFSGLFGISTAFTSSCSTSQVEADELAGTLNGDSVTRGHETFQSISDSAALVLHTRVNRVPFFHFLSLISYFSFTFQEKTNLLFPTPAFE